MHVTFAKLVENGTTTYTFSANCARKLSFLTFRALSQLNIIVLLTFTLSPFDLSVPFLVSSVPFKPSDDSMLTNAQSSA